MTNGDGDNEANSTPNIFFIRRDDMGKCVPSAGVICNIPPHPPPAGGGDATADGDVVVGGDGSLVV